MLKYLFRTHNQIKITKIIICDVTIKNKTIDEIDKLKQNKENETLAEFILSKTVMHDAFEENNTSKLKYFKDNFSLTLPGNGNYYIDVSVENGNENMAKFLITEFGCQPSLYAKQMASVNGHTKLSLWIDVFAKQRNNIGIHDVHRTYNKEKHQFDWNGAILEQFRYI